MFRGKKDLAVRPWSIAIAGIGTRGDRQRCMLLARALLARGQPALPASFTYVN